MIAEDGTLIDWLVWWGRNRWWNPDGSLKTEIIPTIHNASLRVTCCNRNVTNYKIYSLKTGPEGYIRYYVVDDNGKILSDSRGNPVHGVRYGKVVFEYEMLKVSEDVLAKASVQSNLCELSKGQREDQNAS